MTLSLATPMPVVAAERKVNVTDMAITIVTCVGILVVFALPMLWIVFKALQPEDDVFSTSLIPQALTLDNFVRAIKTGFLGPYTLSTTLLSIATCAVVLPIGFLSGYALARFTFIGRGFALFLFMFSLTIPGLVNLLAIYQAFSWVRLINNPIGLVIVYSASSLPLATWLTRAFVLAIPREIEEAGLVDGCSRLACMWRIALPLSLPGLGAIAVFVVVHVFQEYIVAQTLMTTKGVGVVSQGLRMLQSQYMLDYTGLAAGSILVSLVPVGLFLILQKQFIAGMTAGSVTN